MPWHEIKGVDGASIDLDVVCWYQDAAAEAAADAGETAPNNYWIDNADPRTFPVDFPPAKSSATCVGQSNQPFPCLLSDVLDLYRRSLAEPDSEVPATTVLDDETVVATSTVWVHSNGQGADFLYMQFIP
jgi:hypothetical protein